MPELPDVLLYIERLQAVIGGRMIQGVIIKSPFVLQTFDPPIQSIVGCKVRGFQRIGKRIVWELDDELCLVFHLMVAGRFHLKKADAAVPKIAQAAFDFPGCRLLLTEAATRKRATLHLVRGRKGLAEFDRGGLEVLEATLPEFSERLTLRNHTLKRALTDPTLISGIGNAYSDEILHRARLSPLKLTSRLEEAEIERLYQATRTTLSEWIDRLRKEVGHRFPEKVTAFRKEMAVHGKFREPCPDCGSPVQRIAYAKNECNYCARCQTEGRLLADRALSRLLKSDWPRTLEDLEELNAGLRPADPAERKAGRQEKRR